MITIQEGLLLVGACKSLANAEVKRGENILQYVVGALTKTGVFYVGCPMTDEERSYVYWALSDAFVDTEVDYEAIARQTEAYER